MQENQRKSQAMLPKQTKIIMPDQSYHTASLGQLA